MNTKNPSHPEPAEITRATIQDFIARTHAEALAQGRIPPLLGKREIARALGLKGAQRIPLKRILKEIEADAPPKPAHTPVSPTAVAAADITGRDRDGELLAKLVEGGTVRIVAERGRRAGPSAGVGDRVLVRVQPSDGDGPQQARVLKILPPALLPLLGIFRRTDAGGRVEPIEKKMAGRDMLVPDGASQGAEDGDLVSVELLRTGRFGPQAARVLERLGSLSSEPAMSAIAIHARNIPYIFPPAVLEDAAAARPATLKGREDWRDLPLVTIDPPDAKDHDDAVHATEDPAVPSGFIVTVAIADVAAYVRSGSSMDAEAERRGNSVYFPDRVVPMLPERISNDLCSLREGENRPALAVRMRIAPDGHKSGHSFHRVMMRSAAKLAYAQAQAAIEGRPDDATGPLLETVLRPLWAAYDCVKKARDKRGPLDLSLPERKLILKKDGTLDRVIVQERLDAHRLIEEFMILANVAAAETLEEKRTPLVYRVHDEPTVEKITNLADFLATLGIPLARGQVLRPSAFNGLLAKVVGTEHADLVNEVVLRAQAQAAYDPQNYGHFGLNLRRYAHFTSPIRRYADLIVHRALIRALHLGDDGLTESEASRLKETAERISAAERRAAAAERDTSDRLIAAHLADRVGATFPAKISGVTRSGLFVKLDGIGADGYVPAGSIGGDYWRHEEGANALIGDRSGLSYRLGDSVQVKLIEAAPFAGALRFEMLSPGRAHARSATRGGKRAKARKKGGEAPVKRPLKASRGKKR